MAKNSIPTQLLTETISVDYSTAISVVKRDLERYPGIVVEKDGSYFGIVDKKALYNGMHSMKISDSEKIGRYATIAPKISSDTPISDLAYYFHKSGLSVIPYSNAGKVVAVLTRSMLLKVLLSEHYLDKMKLEEHMSTPVAGINANANLAQALSSMDKMRVNRLVVVENGRLYGIITRNDITEMADGEKQRKPQLKDRKAPMSNAPVRDFANKNVISIDLSEDMSKAAREMIERSISSLVVMRSEMPVGMITARDIIEAVVAKKRKEPERIFISGLDETSYQFEDSIREELNSMLLSLDKMHGIAGSYITLNLKRIKLKSYEMSARLQIEGRGIIMVHAQGESFHDAFSGIMHRLKEKALKEKDIMLSERKKDRHTGVDFGESE